jgi:hypothetical protein
MRRFGLARTALAREGTKMREAENRIRKKGRKECRKNAAISLSSSPPRGLLPTFLSSYLPYLSSSCFFAPSRLRALLGIAHE